MSVGSDANAATKAQQWARFARRCCNRRIDPNKFLALAISLQKKLSSLPTQHSEGTNKSTSELGGTESKTVCDALLPIQEQDWWTRDPLTPAYIDSLLSAEVIITVADLLSHLLACRKRRLEPTISSSLGNGAADHQRDHGNHATHSADEMILGTVAKAVSTGHSGLKSLGDAKRLFSALSDWMGALGVENGEMLMGNLPQLGSAAAAEAMLVRESLGLTLLGSFADPKLVKCLDAPQLRDKVRVFYQALAVFISLLSETHMQLAQQLDAYQKSYAALHSDLDGPEPGTLNSSDAMDVGELQLSGVMDLAHVNSRAGTLVYLESFLGGDLPMATDNFMINFVQARYKGDFQTAATDLITASFDVLAITLHTHSQTHPNPAPPSKTFMARCFTVNKLPLLLGTLISMSFADAEFIITQALGRLDAGQFHAFDSQGFGGSDMGGGAKTNNSTLLSDTRQDFLFACALHGLIAEQSIERILGETPMQTLASGGRKTKESLLAEWNSNGQKTDALMQGITAMDGNAGAHVAAVTQVYFDFCTAKDTSSLKSLCVQLCRTGSVLDAVAIFSDWRRLLRPLCEMLNDWKADDDQVEYQPVYDEFSSCLLLVLACVHHFNLSFEDLGLGGSNDSFLRKLLRSGNASIDPSSMTADQNRQLSGWVRALYETEGIGDELMSQCSPQDFYALVPTLISQSIQASMRNKLTSEALINGLELLKEASLIPSLVFAIRWLADHMWEQRGDIIACVVVVTKFINPPPLHGDAHTMHEAVMQIVSQPLIERFRRLQAQSPSPADGQAQQAPKRPDFTQVIDKLERQHGGDDARTTLATIQEIRQWTSGHTGGPLTSLRGNVSMLCFWSTSAGIALTALPAYTARQLGVAVCTSGAQAVLDALLEAIKTQAEAGMCETALDVVTAMLTTQMARLGAHSVKSPAVVAPAPAASRAAADDEGGILTTAMRHADGALTLRQALMLELQGASKTIVTDPFRAETVVRLSRRVEAYAITVPSADAASSAEGTAGAAAAAVAAAAGLGGDAGLLLDSMALGDGSGMVDLTGTGDGGNGEQHHGGLGGDGLGAGFDLGAATGGNNALGLDIDSAMGGSGDGGAVDLSGLGGDAGGGGANDTDLGLSGLGAGDGTEGDDGLGLNLGLRLCNASRVLASGMLLAWSRSLMQCVLRGVVGPFHPPLCKGKLYRAPSQHDEKSHAQWLYRSGSQYEDAGTPATLALILHDMKLENDFPTLHLMQHAVSVREEAPRRDRRSCARSRREAKQDAPSHQHAANAAYGCRLARGPAGTGCLHERRESRAKARESRIRGVHITLHTGYERVVRPSTAGALAAIWCATRWRAGRDRDARLMVMPVSGNAVGPFCDLACGVGKEVSPSAAAAKQRTGARVKTGGGLNAGSSQGCVEDTLLGMREETERERESDPTPRLTVWRGRPALPGESARVKLVMPPWWWWWFGHCPRWARSCARWCRGIGGCWEGVSGREPGPASWEIWLRRMWLGCAPQADAGVWGSEWRCFTDDTRNLKSQIIPRPMGWPFTLCGPAIRPLGAHLFSMLIPAPPHRSLWRSRRVGTLASLVNASDGDQQRHAGLLDVMHQNCACFCGARPSPPRSLGVGRWVELHKGWPVCTAKRLCRPAAPSVVSAVTMACAKRLQQACSERGEARDDKSRAASRGQHQQRAPAYRTAGNGGGCAFLAAPAAAVAIRLMCGFAARARQMEKDSLTATPGACPPVSGQGSVCRSCCSDPCLTLAVPEPWFRNCCSARGQRRAREGAPKTITRDDPAGVREAKEAPCLKEGGRTASNLTGLSRILHAVLAAQGVQGQAGCGAAGPHSPPLAARSTQHAARSTRGSSEWCAPEACNTTQVDSYRRLRVLCLQVGRLCGCVCVSVCGLFACTRRGACMPPRRITPCGSRLPSIGPGPPAAGQGQGVGRASHPLPLRSAVASRQAAEGAVMIARRGANDSRRCGWILVKPRCRRWAINFHGWASQTNTCDRLLLTAFLSSASPAILLHLPVRCCLVPFVVLGPGDSEPAAICFAPSSLFSALFSPRTASRVSSLPPQPRVRETYSTQLHPDSILAHTAPQTRRACFTALLSPHLPAPPSSPLRDSPCKPPSSLASRPLDSRRNAVPPPFLPSAAIPLRCRHCVTGCAGFAYSIPHSSLPTHKHAGTPFLVAVGRLDRRHQAAMDALQSVGFPQPPTTDDARTNVRRRPTVRPTINTRASGKVAQAVQRLSALQGQQMTPPLTPVTPTTASTIRQSPLPTPVEHEQPSFHNYLRAFYHFHPTAPVSSVSEESSITVPINQGDVILVHSIQPNGWADGTLLTSGARGWLPTNYCEAYDHDVIRNLLSALTQVWEFIRGHEDGDTAVFAKQDYVRGMIAGVRVFLERAQCLNRDSPLVQQHSGLRRMRKAILGELSSFVKSARNLQEVCHTPMAPELLYDHLDDIVLKSFKVVTRAVKFLDAWNQDVYHKPTEAVPPTIAADMPLTPPADGANPHTTNPCSLLTVSESGRDDASAAVTPNEDSAIYPDCAPAPLGLRAESSGASHEAPPQQTRVQSQRMSAVFAPNSVAGQRPTSIVGKRASVAHRWSHHASLRGPIARSHVLASERLNSSHDSFLGSLGAYIGLHMQSRWSMDLLVTTQHSVTSCQSLLAVVDEVYERDCRRSEALEMAKETMESSLAELVQATRDIFHVNDESEVFMPDQGRRLVDAATLCVRSAGECVSKTKTVIERIGDFDFEPVEVGGAAQDTSQQQNLDEGIPASADSTVQHNDSTSDMIDQLPLPPLPSQAQEGASEDQMDPPQRPAPSPLAAEFGNIESTDETLVPAPLRTQATVLRASSQASVSRSSSETVVPRDENTQTPTPGLRKFPSLDVDIPRVTDFDFSPSPTESSGSVHVAEVKPPRIDSVGVSSAGTDSYMSSFRRSENSMVSEASTRATTPDQGSEKAPSIDEQTSFGNMSDSRGTIAEEADEVEDQFLAKTYAHELIFNKDGQVTGGSLPALVERLTTHDATPDAIFVNTFYLTFRLFTTPTVFAQALVDRFEFAGDGQEFATPVRLRVYNVFKGWLESHWRPESDSGALPTVLHFATGRLKECLPTASKRLIELTTKLSDATSKPVGQRLLASVGKTSLGGNVPVVADGPAPNPIVSKSQLNALRNTKTTCSILDFDALELARQITLIESRIFCAIQPEELLALEWTKKTGSKAVNVKAKSSLSTDLANLVADSILLLEEPKKRAVVIKHWVKIAKKCQQLNNYDSLMAIVCSLNSSMVTRLKRTWDCVSPKTMTKLAELNEITNVHKNYAALRQRLQFQVAPCLPFVGIYLTDLTFVDVGNQSTRQLSNSGAEGECMSVINFDKQIKTARIIGDLQRFQVPYRLTPVPEMQEWMESQIMRMRESEQADVQHFYRRSQMLEPREASKLAVPKLQTADSFPGASGKPEVREKLDFWNQFHLPSKDKACPHHGLDYGEPPVGHDVTIYPSVPINERERKREMGVYNTFRQSAEESRWVDRAQMKQELVYTTNDSCTIIRYASTMQQEHAAMLSSISRLCPSANVQSVTLVQK
ncbi:hypothetical protein FH972_026377 [Carpinus fangiana]|uniref:Mediator of RNA polymerase II transcription subunit 5 n=1 Tax=Carpinus fangiana TaxID=176857 RepID=A0A5N6L6C5_9ROSI|nr:hypothetical protein FH972_026377 [Carpinus fangiana]